MLMHSASNLNSTEQITTLHDESTLYPYFKNPSKIRSLKEVTAEEKGSTDTIEPI